MVHRAKVLRLTEANRVLEDAVHAADSGLARKGGAWNWDKDMTVFTMADASCSGEDDIVKRASGAIPIQASEIQRSRRAMIRRM